MIKNKGILYPFLQGTPLGLLNSGPDLDSVNEMSLSMSVSKPELKWLEKNLLVTVKVDLKVKLYDIFIQNE